MSQHAEPLTLKCPLCKKPTSSRFKPFCSAGCKDLDLLEWLDGSYRIAGPAALDDEQDFSSAREAEED